MKKIIALCLLISCIGCTNKSQQKGLVYYNDFESIKGWTDILLVKKPVHSGLYSNRLDSVHVYGETLKLTFNEISERHIKKVKIKFWVYLLDATQKSKLVLQIDQPDKKNIFWIGKSIEDYVKKTGEWTEVTLELSLVNEEFQLPQNIIKVFPWNLSKNEMYIDDMRVEFVI